MVVFDIGDGRVGADLGERLGGECSGCSAPGRKTGVSSGVLGKREETRRTVSVVSVAAVRGGSVDMLDPAADGDGTVGKVLDGADGLEGGGRD